MSRVNLRTGTISALFTCLAIAFSPAPALASWGFHKAIREEGHEDFSPVGVGVDEAGNVYASTFFGGGIAKFGLGDELVPVPPTPFGPSFGSGVAVNPASHNVYVVNAEAQAVEAFDSTTGQLQHSFTIPGTGTLFGAYTVVQIAADVHGNVYVPDAPANKIEIFNEEGKAPEGGVASEITGSGATALNGPEGVAVGPTGNVWVADTGNGRIEEFKPNGTFLGEILSPHVQAVTVDSSGDVFASIGGSGIEPQVIEYSPAGAVMASFGKGVLRESGFGLFNGIALDHTREIVYVANLGGLAVQRFTSWADTTGPPTGMTETQATLHGTVEVEAGTAIPSCTFEYGPTTAYGNSVPCAPGGEYTTNTPVSATVSGLTPGVDYHYRISATNAGGFTQVGEDWTFGPPAIDSESVTASATSADVTAQVNPFGLDTTCQVQYVTDASFQSSGYTDATTVPCTPSDLGSGFGDQTVATTLTGLQLNTTYHFRSVATNSAATDGVDGTDQTFTTFGIKAASLQTVVEQNGPPYTQAGGHPYEMIADVQFNTTTTSTQVLSPAANFRDLSVDLPAGLIGDPTATPKCTATDLISLQCSGAAQVGTIDLISSVSAYSDLTVPLYNLVPPAGVPARFGFYVDDGVTGQIDASVRTGGDYGITAAGLRIDPDAGITEIKVTTWGVPADPSHDAQRGCPGTHAQEEGPCSSGAPLVPFLTNPTSCSGPLTATARTDSWQDPGDYTSATSPMPGFTGCDALPFNPSITVQPDTTVADSPSGLSVDLHMPQNGLLNPTGLAEANLKDATVTFPAGMTVDPSSADGLEACSETQVGFTGFAELNKATEAGVQTAQFTPGPAECPNGAKLGTVTIHTPLLEHPIEGGLYLATPHQNPFGSLVAVYLTVYDPISGVVIKLPGEVLLKGETGQLSTTFDQNPQLPFTDLEVDLLGANEAPGKSRASLTTPVTCGAYSAKSSLAPWSGNAAATPSSTTPFQISEGCVGQESEAPNKPAFEAGTASPVAGSYSPFVLKLSREDGSQRFSGLNVTLPPGLIGKIAGIEQCSQADIEAAQARSHEGEGAIELAHPSCPAGSEVGVVHVGAGSGAPFYVTGKAYFAGPYKGAPFSLVIVTPALAGPFDLGTVVVRAALFIDAHTAQVTVKSDPFPTILDGIPLDIRSVAVEMNRNDFVLNPTSCNVMSVTGEEKSTAGNVAGLSSRFQAGGCTSLPFHPSFTASTQGKASKAGGASLTVKVNPLPGQANIAKVDVSLPKQLPSWLPTLQKACTEAQFNANPAGCPAGSDIGSAVAHTPLLGNRLAGPAYLVSHGGAAFPDLEVVLQGEGITLVLDGQTQIKNGVTYSKFETVPDAPVSSFELVLPQGPHHVFAAVLPASAHYSLCGQSLTMPTTITGQNGAVVTQTTKIAVTGCPKVVKKALTRAQKLKAALKVCRTKDKGKSKAKRRQREACEKAAKRKFGPVHKAKSKKPTGEKSKRK